MKSIKLSLAALALSTLTFGAFAADQVSSDPINQGQKWCQPAAG
jgi:multiple stress resistance protein BhsA